MAKIGKKFSQITPASLPPLLTDQFVGVQGGANDRLFSFLQVVTAMPLATATTPGFVQPDNTTLAVNDGVISVIGGGGGPSPANPTATAGAAAVDGSATTYMRSDAAPAVQIASSSVLGISRPDDNSITISGAGVLSVPTATSSAVGLVKPDDVTITIIGGVLSATLQTMGANPTATAGPNAIDGTALTFMRSDAAPAIQIGSSIEKGLLQVDGTTITATGGVITANGAAIDLVVGTTPISGGAATQILFDGGGFLDESPDFTYDHSSLTVTSTDGTNVASFGPDTFAGVWNFNITGNANGYGPYFNVVSYGSGAGGLGVNDPQVSFSRAQGSVASPTAVANDVSLGAFFFGGWDGGQFLFPAAFGGVVDGAVGSGIVPTALSFRTGTNNSAVAEQMRIGSDGIVTFHSDVLNVPSTITIESNGSPILDWGVTTPFYWTSGFPFNFQGGVVQSNDTQGTGITFDNTSSGGHSFNLYSAGTLDGEGPGYFGLFDFTNSTTPMAWDGATGDTGLRQGAIFGWSTSAPFADHRASNFQVSLQSPAAGILVQQRGVGAPQNFGVANTDDGAGNLEYGVLGWQFTTNVFSIGTTKAGTGSSRGFQFLFGGASVGDFAVTNPFGGTDWYFAPSGNLFVSTANTSSTGLVLINASSGGHTFGLFNTGSANASGPGWITFYDATTNNVVFALNGTSGNFQVAEQALFGWSNGFNNASGALETGLSNFGGGLGLGNGTANDVSGFLVLSAVICPSYVGFNASGTNATGTGTIITNGLSTGNATNPDLVFKTGVQTSSGSTQATATTALTLKGETQNANFQGSVSVSLAQAQFLNFAGGASSTSISFGGGIGFYLGGTTDVADYSVTSPNTWTFNSVGGGFDFNGSVATSAGLLITASGSHGFDIFTTGSSGILGTVAGQFGFFDVTSGLFTIVMTGASGAVDIFGRLGWSTGNSSYTAPDTALSRAAAGQLALGTGAAGNSGGSLKLANASFGAGTATTVPIGLTAGTNLTTALAGAIEFDGTCIYGTAVNSARQIIDSEQLITLTSPYTLASQTGAQKLFNATGSGALTVQGTTTYMFECAFALTSMSAGSASFGFAIGLGTASLTAQQWEAIASKSALATASAAQITWNTSANTAIAPSNTTTTGAAYIRGKIRVNAGGTIIPQVSLGSAAAAVVSVDSYFRIWPVGAASVTNVGHWS